MKSSSSARNKSHHRPAADGSRVQAAAHNFLVRTSRRKIGAVRRHEEAGAGGDARRRNAGQFVTNRWLGGTPTSRRQGIDRPPHAIEDGDDSTYERMTKKRSRRHARAGEAEKALGGIRA
jgi:ribosomal protein S2